MSDSTQSDMFTGRVKWFNNKAGYGFITQTSGEGSGTDVFVHHSAIQVSTEQFKYLVDGEYVTFSVVPMADASGNDTKTQAGDVRGVDGGALMCETRNASRGERQQRQRAPQNGSGRGRGGARGKGRGRGRGGRGGGSTRPQQRRRVETTVAEEDGVLTVRPVKTE